MGFFNRNSTAKAKNKCPVCRGKGYHAFSGSDFFTAEHQLCTSCNNSNSSSLFTKWEDND
ncbi:hypothetical protein [Neobacillus dielmonensis]|uniref:hypothetical protein n=1 Tax=Neobacillus dielmonensis TaxID=1347369 RepID=UPI0005A966A6|nr:hypothetical protein [Neobacillus dielmonensis]